MRFFRTKGLPTGPEPIPPIQPQRGLRHGADAPAPGDPTDATLVGVGAHGHGPSQGSGGTATLGSGTLPPLGHGEAVPVDGLARSRTHHAPRQEVRT